MKENPSNSSSSPPHPHSSSIHVIKTSITKKRKPRVLNGDPAKKTSIYKGVTKHRSTGRYEAHLWDRDAPQTPNTQQKKKGRQVYLGGYENEDAAARTCDLAALKYWGINTTLNFPMGLYEKEIAEMQSWTKEGYVAYLRRQSSGFSRGISKYRGVAKHHVEGKWEARIGKVDGKRYLYLGTYDSEEEAAIAYDQAAIIYKGDRAVTNFFNHSHPNKNNTIPKINDARENDEQQDCSPDEQGKYDKEMNVLSQMHEFSSDINSYKDRMIDIENWLVGEVEQSWSPSPNIVEFPQLNVSNDGTYENPDEVALFSPLFNSGPYEILDEAAPSFDYNHHENPGELLNFSELDSHKMSDDLGFQLNCDNYEMSTRLTPSVNEISLVDNNLQSLNLLSNEQLNQNYQLNQHGIVNDEKIGESTLSLDHSHHENPIELSLSIDDFVSCLNHENHEKLVESASSVNEISLADNNLRFKNLFPNGKPNHNYQVNQHGIVNDNSMQTTAMNQPFDLDEDITSSNKYLTGGKTHDLIEKEAMEKKMHFQC